MAQFTAGGRGLKSLFTADGMSVGFETKDPFNQNHYHCRRYGNLSNKSLGGTGGRGLRFFYLPSLPQRDTKYNLRFVGGGFAVHSSSAPSPSSASRNSNSDGVDEFLIEEDPEFEIIDDELSGFRGLVLDISYRPVNVVCWKRAICLEFMDKADVLEYYDQTVNSPSGSFYIPAVLRVPHLLQVVKRRRVKRGLSRKNILHRDNYTCQYCCSRENLTIDHVLPIARGGKWTWENLVAACARCNSKKGQKTLEEANMKLLKIPKAAKEYDILAIPLTNYAFKMLKMRKGMPEEWRQYLSKPYAAP